MLHGAVRGPLRWFTVRRLVWLVCIGLCGFVIWGAGTHLGPGLRAAHGEGTPGLWTAQQQNGGTWTGVFVSSTGTETLPDVGYTGSLPGVQAGTVVPALDAGAGDEVYPMTGSDKWVRDLTGVVAGTLALLALLGRGFYVARRRRRAPRPDADYLTQAVEPSDYLTQAATPRGRLRRRSPSPPRTRAGKLGLLALGGAVTVWATAKFVVLLADTRPYTGWYWLLAVASGIVLAVGLPWALILGARRPARWAGWLLLGYTAALAGFLRYYLSVRFTPPIGAAPTAPPPLFVIELVGLAAEAVTFAVISVLLLAVMAEVIAPGPVGRWLRSRRWNRAPTGRRGQGLANTPDRDA